MIKTLENIQDSLFEKFKEFELTNAEMKMVRGGGPSPTQTGAGERCNDAGECMAWDADTSRNGAYMNLRVIDKPC